MQKLEETVKVKSFFQASFSAKVTRFFELQMIAKVKNFYNFMARAHLKAECSKKILSAFVDKL